MALSPAYCLLRRTGSLVLQNSVLLPQLTSLPAHRCMLQLLIQGFVQLPLLGTSHPLSGISTVWTGTEEAGLSLSPRITDTRILCSLMGHGAKVNAGLSPGPCGFFQTMPRGEGSGFLCPTCLHLSITNPPTPHPDMPTQQEVEMRFVRILLPTILPTFFQDKSPKFFFSFFLTGRNSLFIKSPFIRTHGLMTDG